MGLALCIKLPSGDGHMALAAVVLPTPKERHGENTKLVCSALETVAYSCSIRCLGPITGA